MNPIVQTFSFIRRYGWLILFALVTALVTIAMIVLRKKPTAGLTMATTIKTELAGIRAEGELERRLAAKGAEAATAEVNLAYEKQKHELEERERVEAQRLKDDPVALAGMLARAGARKQYRSG